MSSGKEKQQELNLKNIESLFKIMKKHKIDYFKQDGVEVRITLHDFGVDRPNKADPEPQTTMEGDEW